MTAFEIIDTQTACAKNLFGVTPDGIEVFEYVLSNTNGLSVGILTYGGIIRFIKTPDRSGHLSDIILGFDDLESYMRDTTYMGAIVGRYANRISEGVFRLNDQSHDLDQNENGTCLHGGTKGFNQAIWKPITISNDAPSLKLSHLSYDGENGFPGNLLTTITYTLSEENELILDITAISDKRTVVNITAHPYFNLANDHTKNATSHFATICADKYLPIDKFFIPTGEIKEIVNSAFDLKRETRIESALKTEEDQLRIAQGFDHCFVFDDQVNAMKAMATLRDELSGRRLKVSSNAPGIQFYTANFLGDGTRGKNSKPLLKYGAVCLEPQHLPNAPNENSFPSSVLEAGANYHHKIVYAFDIA